MTSTQIIKAPPRNPEEVKLYRSLLLERFERARATLLKKTRGKVDLDEVFATIQLAILRDPKLLECSPDSLFWSFVSAIELGLPVNDPSGDAFIGSFSQKGSNFKRATLIPGYKG